MEKLLKFLSNPHNTGLNIKTYKLELDKIAEFYNYARGSRYSRRDERDFIETLFDRDERDQKRYFMDRLTYALSILIRNELKPEICDFFKFKPEDLEVVNDDDKRVPVYVRFRRFVRGFLRPRIYPEHFELLHIDYKISKRKKIIMIELISLKEIGLKLFDDLISCLPVLSDSLVEISNRKSHSEKYIFKLYSMGVQLWGII